MTQFLLALLLAVAADDQQQQRRTADTQHPGSAGAASGMLDGQWQLVYGERNGQRMENAGGGSVTIHNNILTFNREGQQHSWRLSFGPHQTVTAWRGEGQGGHAGAGISGAGGTSGTRSGAGTTGTSGARGNAGTGGVGNTTGTSGTGGLGNAAGAGATGTARGHDAAGNQGGSMGAHHGVYILSHEYLCISFEDDSAMGTGHTGAAGTGATGTGNGIGAGRTGTGTGTGIGGARTATGAAGGTTGTTSTGSTLDGTGSQAHRANFVMILHRQGGGTGRSTGR